MQTYRVQRDSPTVLAGILHAGESFEGQSIRGESNAIPSFRAEMPHEEWSLLDDRHNVSPIEYAVFSYDTIIGYKWNGEWFIPNVTYSRTTSMHQNKLRIAVNY